MSPSASERIRKKYIKKFNGIALMVIGKKNMLRLFELDSIEEQKEFFDD